MRRNIGRTGSTIIEPIFSGPLYFLSDKGEPSIKNLFAMAVLKVACLSVLWMPTARTPQNDEAEIRQLLDRRAKAA
jgi:hypothetical protein